MKAESRPPSPPRPVAMPAPAPEPSKPGLAAAPRRGDSERARGAWLHREPDAALSGDGQLFSQLIQPADARPGDQGLGGGRGIAWAAQAEEVPGEWIDTLAQRLGKAPLEALDVTLLMPHLGTVNVRATPGQGQWRVELGFTRRDVLRRLRPRERQCEAALANALGQPVELALYDEANL
jgi:hypothetical protein